MITVLLMGLTSLVIWLSSAYFFIMLGLGVRRLHREKIKLPQQSQLRYGKPHLGRQDDMFVYFMIPCLNEEQVIGHTVARLVGDRASHVVVIDDGSDDATGDVAKLAGGDEVTVLRRELPDARRGKGEALNAGLALVRSLVVQGSLDPQQVLICVMDADGHLSNGAVRHVTRCFEDPAVGGVQLAVRIRNRDTFLARVQDFYFWAIASVTQFGRATTATVSLGGNGQFSRLTALDEVGARPWSRCLTEDLDLSITMALRGWKLTTTPHAAVSQQGVHKIKALVRQRARWYQGHMSCGRRLPEVWHSPHLNHVQATELSMYLLVPWVLDLPWSILWHVSLFNFVAHLRDYFIADADWATTTLSVALWYLLSFGPALLASLLQKRRSPDTNWARALLLGHSFLLMNYLFFLCAWKAVFALASGRNDWAKTDREFEEAGALPPPRRTTKTLEAGPTRAD
ncbi:glycosyltransferase family 2 protein [Kitasatospora sp. LaBMicrA B282]|uniref:glycosyltransferase family 2 protein n=1 Tax=Kitasatospora sp. LaBMicrA B282 TaxID=3420949 RepID=UPI003D119174